MAEIVVNGGIVVYEFIGPEDAEVVVLTPGGRFGKDYPGVRPLAEAIAAGGKRVLLWDRPNCGGSDIQVFGRSESHMRAETLAGMIDVLVGGPVAVLGGSGGARDSIVFAIEYPHLVSSLALWSIVGGTFSTMTLAMVYAMSELRTVRSAGLEGVLEMPGLAGSWSDLVDANPRNRDRLLDMGAARFEEVMTEWFDAFVPKPNETIPGVTDWEVEGIEVPTLIIRGGDGDRDHPKRTSYVVHSLISNSRLIEPPWAEDAWERAQKSATDNEGSVFDPWIEAAPVLLDHIDRSAAGSETV
ncbi:alpha/beta hydrolase [Rhodococcus fascians]|nr:alpha/beta hydrolase [Rhodococcus fascians]MBY4140948.1 alpha/beta hydrolase [Rhodococcus fascians]MBY4219612.1 alpha/beta hydrolase [Rhodococcus fascians]MBY4221921.1 alpha/beta hydrolase [Rhodococcus fascians]MBY4233922.1 alpha/beta hydrolase [Rhodococcus fascians]